VRWIVLFALCGACSDSVARGRDLAVSADGGAVDLATTSDLSGDMQNPVGFDLVPPCWDTVTEVYTTPFGLPALTAATQGDIVRCYRDNSLDQDGPGVDATLQKQNIALGISASGVIVYRVGFRTSRANGQAAMSTARVYLPTRPKALPLPVIVAGHPSEGMGDGCASSKNPSALQEVSLPWAASGYAVITPDYAGLGDEGVQGYVDNRDQGYSLLDGARALRKMFPAGAFNDEVVIAGWSQGGGAALSAQALAKTYGAGGTLAAVVAFAPEWPIRYNSFGFTDLVTHPDSLVSFTPTGDFSYSNHLIWTMRAYGFFASFSTLTSDGGIAFPTAAKANFLAHMDSTCGLVGLGAQIYLDARPSGGAKNSDLFDPSFLTAFTACLADSTQAACSGVAKELYLYLGQNHLTSDASGAPVLMVQGLSDTVLPPASEAACIAQKLVGDGVAAQVCVDSTAKHTDVTQRNIGYAIGWVEAKLSGNTTPSCAELAQLPAPSCN
jgi:hypothetical protein